MKLDKNIQKLLNEIDELLPDYFECKGNTCTYNSFESKVAERNFRLFYTKDNNSVASFSIGQRDKDEEVDYGWLRRTKDGVWNLEDMPSYLDGRVEPIILTVLENFYFEITTATNTHRENWNTNIDDILSKLSHKETYKPITDSITIPTQTYNKMKSSIESLTTTVGKQEEKLQWLYRELNKIKEKETTVKPVVLKETV